MAITALKRKYKINARIVALSTINRILLGSMSTQIIERQDKMHDILTLSKSYSCVGAYCIIICFNHSDVDTNITLAKIFIENYEINMKIAKQLVGNHLPLMQMTNLFCFTFKRIIYNRLI